MVLTEDYSAEIVETTFVVASFTDVRKETTSFLVVPKRNDQKRQLYSVVFCQNKTRNHHLKSKNDDVV